MLCQDCYFVEEFSKKDCYIKRGYTPPIGYGPVLAVSFTKSNLRDDQAKRTYAISDAEEQEYFWPGNIVVYFYWLFGVGCVCCCGCGICERCFNAVDCCDYGEPCCQPCYECCECGHACQHTCARVFHGLNLPSLRLMIDCVYLCAQRCLFFGEWPRSAAPRAQATTAGCEKTSGAAPSHSESTSSGDNQGAVGTSSIAQGDIENTSSGSNHGAVGTSSVAPVDVSQIQISVHRAASDNEADPAGSGNAAAPVTRMWCIICLCDSDPRSGGKRFHALECGHWFHGFCLQMLCNSRFASCPICRAPISDTWHKAIMQQPETLPTIMISESIAKE